MKNLLLAATVSVVAASSAWAAPRTATLNVSNMTCSTCPITVKRALTKVKGVIRALVDFDRKQAVVSFDDAVTTPSALIRATTEAGYPSYVAPSDRK